MITKPTRLSKIRYGARADKVLLQQIMEEFQDMKLEDLTPVENTTMDMKFHSYIFSLASNVYYDILYNSISNQNFRISVLGGQLPLERREQSRMEHIEIVKHLLSGNFQQAAPTMEKHILRAQQSKYELILKNMNFAQSITF